MLLDQRTAEKGGRAVQQDQVRSIAAIQREENCDESPPMNPSRLYTPFILKNKGIALFFASIS
jgi:hypothetical protein